MTSRRIFACLQRSSFTLSHFTALKECLAITVWRQTGNAKCTTWMWNKSSARLVMGESYIDAGIERVRVEGWAGGGGDVRWNIRLRDWRVTYVRLNPEHSLRCNNLPFRKIFRLLERLFRMLDKYRFLFRTEQTSARSEICRYAFNPLCVCVCVCVCVRACVFHHDDQCKCRWQILSCAYLCINYHK